MFAGNYAPKGWQLCNGQTLPINQYTALFSLIGTYYGGNGISTFMLPNLQGSLPVGQGQGPGLTMRVIGEVGGSENVTITNQTMPAHNHQLMASSVKASVGSIGPTALQGAVISGLAGDYYALNVGSPPPTFGTLNPASLAANGGSTPHPNLMPSLCVSFIIAMVGLFPSRN
jgi:microcystin-dependent protein